MKKVLFYAFCVVVPGRIVLLGAAAVLKRFALRGPLMAISALMLAGCYSTVTYETNNGKGQFAKVYGKTLDTVGAIVATSVAERNHAEAKCIEKDGLAKCYGWGAYGFGAMDMTQGGMWAPVGATPPVLGQTVPAQNKDMEEIRKDLLRLKDSQRLLIEASRTKGKSK